MIDLLQRARIAAEAIGPALSGAGWTLATAESCTGGLVGHLITQVSGCSAYYRGGVISYENAVKQSLLGVTADDLREHGAVSEQVVAQMARGVCEPLGADVGISVTGIAGPLGGARAKPVGTVYIGLCLPVGEFVEHHVWDSDREGNKLLSAVAALEMLAKTIVVDWP